MSILVLFAVALGLVILLGTVVVCQTVCARHPLIAMVFGLAGIACLVLGMVAVGAWTRHRVVRHRHAATAAHAGGQPADVVRLDVNNNGELRYPASASSVIGSASDANATENTADDADESRTATAQATTIPLDDTPAKETVEPERSGQPAGGTTPELGSSVEIDFDARPDWVDQPDRDVGQLHQISVDSGPFLRLRSARKELDKQLKLATDEYISDVVGHPHAARWVGYDEETIRRRFVAPEHLFDEKVISPSFGPMHQSHALLEFGPDFHREVEQAWRNVRARAQLGKVALGGVAILGVLVLLFGYFTADTASRGFYSGRLKFITIIAILALVATGFAIARSIPWLWL